MYNDCMSWICDAKRERLSPPSIESFLLFFFFFESIEYQVGVHTELLVDNRPVLEPGTAHVYCGSPPAHTWWYSYLSKTIEPSTSCSPPKRLPEKSTSASGRRFVSGPRGRRRLTIRYGTSVVGVNNVRVHLLYLTSEKRFSL